MTKEISLVVALKWSLERRLEWEIWSLWRAFWRSEKSGGFERWRAKTVDLLRLNFNSFFELDDSEGANIAYSNSISLFKNFPKGWISWGNYCDKAYKETNDEIWLQYAVSCFLQDIKFGMLPSRAWVNNCDC